MVDPVCAARRRGLLIMMVGAVTGVAALAGCERIEEIPAGAMPHSPGESRGAIGDQLDSYMRHLARLGYSGSVFVRDADGVVLSRGYGWADRRPQRAIDDSTAFYVASVAKAVTAAAVLRLVAEGRLSLQDSLSRFIPGVPDDKRAITVDQLLTHTAGLQLYHDQGTDELTLDQALSRILEAPLERPPGTAYSYSNSGYTLLARIVEVASADDFREFVRRAVLVPAGMSMTGWQGDTIWGPGQVAHGFSEGRDRSSPNDIAATWTILGAGGMISTPSDLSSFCRALFDGDLLPASLRDEMWTPVESAYVPTQLEEDARGWRVWHRDDGGRLAVEKAGYSSRGFTAMLRCHPETGSVIALAFNTIDLPYAFPHSVVTNRLLRILEGAVLPAGRPGGGTGSSVMDPGGSVALESVGTMRLLRASGQLAIDALIPGSPDELTRRARLNRASRTIVEEALAGIEPSANVAASSLIDELRERAEAGAGTSVHVLGTLPEYFMEAEGHVSFLEVEGEDARRRFRLHWDPADRLRTIGGSAFHPPVIAIVSSDSSEQMSVYHPGFNVEVEAEMRQTDGGRALCIGHNRPDCWKIR